MSSVQELKAAVEAAESKVKKLVTATREARVELDKAREALETASGPKVPKEVKEEGDIAAGVGKDPKLAMSMARALLANGFEKGKKRIFTKDSDAFRQLDSGRWIRRVPGSSDGWLDIQQRVYNFHTQEDDPEPELRVVMEKAIQGICNRSLSEFTGECLR